MFNFTHPDLTSLNTPISFQTGMRGNKPSNYSKFIRRFDEDEESGFTRTETVITAAMFSLLVAVAIPMLAGSQPLQDRVVCANNLRQIGQAFLSFGDAHGDLFPQKVEAGAGGSYGSGVAADHFRVLSNYVTSARTMTCPRTSRLPAKSFQSMADTNLSYVLGAHASPMKSFEILSGDLDMEEGTVTQCNAISPTHISVITWMNDHRNSPANYAGWSGTNHIAFGHVLLSDGSVVGGETRDLRRIIADSDLEGSTLLHVVQPR